MTLYRNNLMPDSFLLWYCGLVPPGDTQPDRLKMAIFFGVSEATAKRWVLRGLPSYARRQLCMIIDGRMLPTTWRGAKLVHDGIWLDSGHHVPLEHIKHWPFIMRCVDWSKVPPLAKPKADKLQSGRIN